MFANALVQFYLFWHGRLGLPGAGLLLRLARKLDPALHDFPLCLDGQRVGRLDFRDQASFSLLNYRAGDLGNHRFLFQEMAARLRPGDVLWDVGANVGLVSLYFAQDQFSLKKIHSFEPSPGPWKTLQSLFLSDPRVSPHPWGLSSSAGEGCLVGQGADSSYGAIRLSEKAGPGEKVFLRAGDQLVLSGLEPPHLIKIDVEGHEPAVLAGLKETIRKYGPAIFFEHIFLSPGQIRSLIPPGYKLSFLLEDGTWTEDFDQRFLGHEALLSPPPGEALFLPKAVRPGGS